MQIQGTDHPFPGGSSGIGLATVTLLSSLGASVISADINPPPAPHPSVYVQTDVTQWTSLTKLFKSALAAHGRLDFVFANAGIGPRANYLALDTDADGELLEPATATLDVNLNSVVNTASLAVHYMKTQPQGGSIVLMGSSTSLHPVRAIDYCACFRPPPPLFVIQSTHLLPHPQQPPKPACWASAAASPSCSPPQTRPSASTASRPAGPPRRCSPIWARC